LREDEFSHEVAFGVHRLYQHDGQMALHGVCTRGKILAGQVFTSLWKNYLAVPEDNSSLAFNLIGSVQVRVIAVMLFGMQVKWAEPGEMCALKVEGEGIDRIGQHCVLSIPTVEKPS
jgi:hypothetical protein